LEGMACAIVISLAEKVISELRLFSDGRIQNLASSTIRVH